MERGGIVLPSGAARVIQLLKDGGYRAYAVGGCVRDSLRGVMPNDWDICTSATPEQMLRVFKGLRLIETGLKHGTVTVLLEGEPYEVTTFRIDGAYTDHRHPDSVAFTDDITLDLSRRDFTMNAMAYSPHIGLVDPFDGRRDLSERRIRCVGKARRRFEEDPLRILRAIRFASVMDMDIDAQTGEMAKELSPLLRHVSAERIAVELKKLLMGASVGRILAEYSAVLRAFIPELPADSSEWRHTVNAISASVAALPVRLALLLGGLGGELANAVLCRLKLDNETIQTVTTLVALRRQPIPQDASGIRHMLCDIGERRLRLLLEVWRADHCADTVAPSDIDPCARAVALLDEVLSQGQCYQLADMHINGRDLIALGAPRGKAIGELLSGLLEQVLNGTLDNERQQLVEAARAMIAGMTR